MRRPRKIKTRRPTPSYWTARENYWSRVCLCGCLTPVEGKKFYVNATHRKRRQRELDKADKLGA